MKIVSIILSLFLAHAVFAQSLPELRKAAFEGKKDCKGSVYANDSYAYYTNNKSMTIIDLKTGQDVGHFTTSQPITAIKTDAQNLYVLTEGNIELWNLSGQQQISTFATHPNDSAPYDFYSQPRGFAVTGDRIYIAHGVAGVIVLNRKDGKVETVISVKSTVRDLAIVDKTAILVLDNNTADGFHGFAYLNLQNNQIQKYTSVDNVFPESINIFGDTLLVGYYNAIWKYQTQEVLANANPSVVARVFKFPAGQGSIVGKSYFDEKYMYACYNIVEENSEHTEVVVFDRGALGL